MPLLIDILVVCVFLPKLLFAAAQAHPALPLPAGAITGGAGFISAGAACGFAALGGRLGLAAGATLETQKERRFDGFTKPTNRRPKFW